MAHYTINYVTGDIETLDADSVRYDDDAQDYTFYLGNEAVALAPATNIRSIHRQVAGHETADG